ncbi:MAG: DoxX family protein [bacterium]
MLFKSLERYHDAGLLVLRIGIGIMFALHGYPKITGGPEKWTMIGGAIGFLGIHFAPVFWGFMAAVSEFCGGILLVVGFLFRPASVLLTITMIVATSMHIGKGDTFGQYSHALESAILFLSLFLIGPGKYSIDARLCGACKQ